jgi:hypothetical protein
MRLEVEDGLLVVVFGCWCDDLVSREIGKILIRLVLSFRRTYLCRYVH